MQIVSYWLETDLEVTWHEQMDCSQVQTEKTKTLSGDIRTGLTTSNVNKQQKPSTFLTRTTQWELHTIPTYKVRLSPSKGFYPFWAYRLSLGCWKPWKRYCPSLNMKHPSYWNSLWWQVLPWVHLHQTDW